MRIVMGLMQKLDVAKTVAESGAAHPLPTAHASNAEQAENAAFAELEEMELETNDVDFKDADLHELERQAAVAKRQLE